MKGRLNWLFSQKQRDAQRQQDVEKLDVPVPVPAPIQWVAPASAEELLADAILESVQVEQDGVLTRVRIRVFRAAPGRHITIVLSATDAQLMLISQLNQPQTLYEELDDLRRTVQERETISPALARRICTKMYVLSCMVEVIPIEQLY